MERGQTDDQVKGWPLWKHWGEGTKGDTIMFTASEVAARERAAYVEGAKDLHESHDHYWSNARRELYEAKAQGRYPDGGA